MQFAAKLHNIIIFNLVSDPEHYLQLSMSRLQSKYMFQDTLFLQNFLFVQYIQYYIYMTQIPVLASSKVN